MKRFLASFSVIILALVAACSSPVREQPIASQHESADTLPMMYIVNDDENQELGRIVLSQEPVIQLKETKVFSRWTKEKRKYSDAQGNTIYEIKYSDDGFKVRNPAGEMLWKIKVRDNKIQVADNEEMENPFELHPGEGGNGRAMLGQQNIAELETGGMISPVKLSGVLGELWISGPTVRYESLVLQLKDIEPLIRYIILTEILAAG